MIARVTDHYEEADTRVLVHLLDVISNSALLNVLQTKKNNPDINNNNIMPAPQYSPLSQDNTYKCFPIAITKANTLHMCFDKCNLKADKHYATIAADDVW